MITKVRGVHDVLPGEVPVWRLLEEGARLVFSRYGYQELRTPIFEKTELFARAVGATSDIIEKEMYTFPDRGNDSLSLRPEGTAAVVRAFIENKLHHQCPWAVYYMGPMFRYERPQKGRYRQFHQIGCELFGAEGPLADAEMMAMALRFLHSLGVEQTLTLEINSLGCAECRAPYRAQLLTFLEANSQHLCAHCHQRLQRNPLRVLDCKGETCRSVARQAPAMKDYLCVACDAHFSGVTHYLTDLQLPFEINPQMVRGLDYYNRTAFEITTTALGAQNAVAAGGRYDGLVAELTDAHHKPAAPEEKESSEAVTKRKGVPAIGFAMGMERLVLLLQTSRVPVSRPPLYLVVVGEEVRSMAMVLAEQLRDAGLSVTSDLLGGSMKSQMKRANRSQARFTLIIGEQEVVQRCIIVKDMSRGEQQTFSWDEAATKLCHLLKAPFLMQESPPQGG